MLSVFNSMGKKLEVFSPISCEKVKMYVCGITAYDYCHLGHARAAVVFDVIRNYLEYLGYDVTYVRNFTDVDDKIINRANELNVDCGLLAEKYILAYKEDMKRLGVRDPDVEPRATEHIDEIIKLVECLQKKGFAYECDGNVFFDIMKFSDYGKLSNRRVDEMIAGARVSIDDRKRNPMDFALWKASKPKEPSWPSPWGYGRPAWHIECSAMSMKYLGEQIDIHGGGEDLLFPHHENEIAQSEAATGKEFVKYWIHNGFVRINKEKMSKSTGNFFLMKDLFSVYDPEILRYFLLSTHYRTPLDYSSASVEEAGKALKRLKHFVHNLSIMVSDWEKVHGKVDFPQPGVEIPLCFSKAVDKFEKNFRNYMNADFNTPRAISVFFELVRDINVIVNDPLFQIESYNVCVALKVIIGSVLRHGAVLGILNEDASRFLDKPLVISEENKKLIEELLVLREEKRRVKEWAEADAIREEVQSKFNVVVVDKPSEIIIKDKEGFEIFSIMKK